MEKQFEQKKPQKKLPKERKSYRKNKKLPKPLNCQIQRKESSPPPPPPPPEKPEILVPEDHEDTKPAATEETAIPEGELIPEADPVDPPAEPEVEEVEEEEEETELIDGGESKSKKILSHRCLRA
jgi:hypothetical protein